MTINKAQRDLAGPAGNYYDKQGSKNPIARYLHGGFIRSLTELLDAVEFSSVQEFGCGEGHLAGLIAGRYRAAVCASDASGKIIEKAKKEYGAIENLSFGVKSIYALDPEKDSAELIVCCEVLEHLEEPEKALSAVGGLRFKYLVVSVPREPLWRALNMMRGKYLASLGNTPGHIQHWSRPRFIDCIGRRFTIKAVRTPTPWTMLLCEKKK
jgi:2-polyprenyl-3-methyl-5-hydroxy-6-metoxy-1,4-benzoquinol methylase